MDRLYRATQRKSVNKDGSVRFRLTEKKVDRHGEVVDPAGAILDTYAANPVVLFAHGMSQEAGMMPIGKIKPDSIKKTKSYIDADIVFDDSGEDKFASLVADKVRNGFLNAGSIGFKSLEVDKRPLLRGQTGVTHKQWELMEFSIVPIPALPSATARREFEDFLAKSFDLGISIDSQWVDAIEDIITMSDKLAERNVKKDEDEELFSIQSGLTFLPCKNEDKKEEESSVVTYNVDVSSEIEDFMQLYLQNFVKSL